VDDGAPRRVDDPSNADFVDSIGRGECPTELDPGPGGAPVTVNLMRRDAEYEAPAKPKYVAFQGAGQTLAGGGGGGGGAGGGDEGEGDDGGAAAIKQTAAKAAASASDGGGEWSGVDEASPTTSLQLRMADGSRLVARFNSSHTLGDVRRFVRASRPDLAAAPYAFASGGFPPKPVTDEDASLEALGLLNAVLVQRRA
jgi:UBX domain-containing protein 1